MKAILISLLALLAFPVGAAKIDQVAWPELYVTAIQTNSFQLNFKGVIKFPDGSLKFQLNIRSNHRTYFRKLDEDLEGFKLIKFEEKRVDNVRGLVRRIDVSELTLQRGNKTIVLVKGKIVRFSEYIAHLILLSENQKFIVKEDEEFHIRKVKYKIKRIDPKLRRVLIIHTESEKEKWIQPLKKNAEPRDELDKK